MRRVARVRKMERMARVVKMKRMAGARKKQKRKRNSQCVAPRALSARRANVDSRKNLLEKLATAEGNNKKLIPGQGA